MAERLITLAGKLTYLHGANMAWLSYGQDFGLGQLATPGRQAEIANWFSMMSACRMNTVRWFMFPAAAPQIQRSSAGVPTGIDPRVYADLDVALELAGRYGLALNLVIFDRPETIPQSWLTDSATRLALMGALGGMFSRYASEPRILAWELFNEADNRIIPPTFRVDPAGLKATIGAFTARVHATSNTLATTSNGGAGTLDYFTGLGLDFYSAHWYDTNAPVRADSYNVLLNDAAHYTALHHLDKPLLIGEFFADFRPGAEGTTTEQKYAEILRGGYAGGWGWSASAGANDGMRIDWAAAKRFGDTGPG